MMLAQYLYKYGRIHRQCKERSEKLFAMPHIWFSSPAELNDPFECRPWINGEGTRDQVVDFLVRMFKKNFPHWSEQAVIAEAATAYLEGRQLQPEVWEGFRQELVATLDQSIGIYCLSAVCDELLMWSHYADEHRGYCLMFEGADATPFFGNAQQVVYSSELPAINVFSDAQYEQATKALLTKYCGWSYEKEWRIVDHDQGSGARSYPSELLVGVIFGARMPACDRSMIRGWLRGRPTPVKFYEAVQSERHYRVEIRPAN
jgi:hypothetical protein